MVFIHGFNVTHEESRAAGAEMFKRLWQGGSKAKFTSVTWYGDMGKSFFKAAYYQKDAYTAFLTAPCFASFVNSLGTPRTVVAHSLGNMVVSSAIVDYGLSVRNYFMVNAAVAAEAYDASQWKGADFARMTPSAWVGYPTASFSATWHTYFSDDRADLRWEERFAGVANKTALFNYYSTGDEVLTLGKVAPKYDITGVLHWDLSITERQYAWHKQETHKGLGTVSGFASTSWAGWGFGNPTHIEWDVDPTTGARYPKAVPYYPDAAAARRAWSENPAQLRDIPVFLQNPPGMFASDISVNLRREIIARGIPALSGPAGSRAIAISATDNDERNVDMNGSSMRPNGWPRSGGNYGNQWLHGDWKDVAFFYNHRLYEDIVAKGGLK